MTRYLTRVRTQVRLHTRRTVLGLLDGEYTSLLPGRSTEFNDLRTYVRGDDVKDIDWKASARTRTTLVRRYAGVRKLTLLLVVSTGRSMTGAMEQGVAKSEVAVLVSGIFCDLALRHGDRVALLYGDADHQEYRPANGTEHRLEEALGALDRANGPGVGRSDARALLGQVARLVRRRTVMVVVCDEIEVDEGLVAALRRVQVQHDVLLMTIGDLPPTAVPASVADVREIEGGGTLPAWLRADPRLAGEYSALVDMQSERFDQELRRLAVVHEHVGTSRDAVPAVLRLLERHRRAR